MNMKYQIIDLAINKNEADLFCEFKTYDKAKYYLDEISLAYPESIFVIKVIVKSNPYISNLRNLYLGVSGIYEPFESVSRYHDALTGAFLIANSFHPCSELANDLKLELKLALSMHRALINGLQS